MVNSVGKEMHFSHLSKVLRGERPFLLMEAIQLAEILGVTLNEIGKRCSDVRRRRD
jgi:hypothetical protein